LQHTESIDPLDFGQSLHRKNGFAEEFKIITLENKSQNNFVWTIKIIMRHSNWLTEC